MELWRPVKNGANMTAVLTRAAKLISGFHREASRTAFFKDRPVNQDVMLADLDILSAADHSRMAHAHQHARQAASAAAAATYVHNDPCSPEFRIALSAAYAPDYMGAAVWQGLHVRDAWCAYARTCHETALSHGVRSASKPTRAAPGCGSQHDAQRHQDWNQCVGTCVQGPMAAVTWHAWAAPRTSSPCTSQVGCRYP